jgi:rsbT co-antagonist protein RsbR
MSDLSSTDGEHFRLLAEQSPVAMWIHHEGHFRYANPATEAMLGYTVAELQTMLVWDIIHPDYRQVVRERARQRQNGDDPQSRYDVQILTRSGSTRWVSLDAQRVIFQGEQHILVTFLDISDQKAYEAQLRASEERFRHLVENIGVSILIHRNGEILYVNPAAELLTGYSADELRGINFARIVHSEDLDLVHQRSAARMRGEPVPRQYEIRMLTSEGETRWLSLSNDIVQVDGAPAILVTATDITPLKRSEEHRIQLQEQMIAAQQSALRELSTPLIPITDSVVVMPLIGQMDDSRSQQVMETLLHGITVQRARIAILDITGVPEVDSQTARALVQVAQAAQLLGAQIILTGIRPDVAHSLVSLQIELPNIATHSSLQEGISSATRRLR